MVTANVKCLSHARAMTGHLGGWSSSQNDVEDGRRS